MIIPTFVEEYLNNSDYVISTRIIEAYDSKENKVDDASTLIDINSKNCTIKTLKPGFVQYRIKVRRADDSEDVHLIETYVQLKIKQNQRTVLKIHQLLLMMTKNQTMIREIIQIVIKIIHQIIIKIIHQV